MNNVEKELLSVAIEEALGDNKEQLISFLGKFIDDGKLDRQYIILDVEGKTLNVHFAEKITTNIEVGNEDVFKTKDLSFILDIYNELKTS